MDLRVVEELMASFARACSRSDAGSPEDRGGRLLARLELGLKAHRDPSAGWCLEPVEGLEGAAPHRLVLEAGIGRGTGVGGVVSAQAVARRPEVTSGSQTPTGVDPGTLRRRLELVLGGPPGFTTGARAEILVDLLMEFGRDMVVDSIRREWVTQFETGPDASSSVSRP